MSSDPRATDPSLNELNQRLLEIKKGPNAELAKVTSVQELETRFKQLKNLSEEDLTDEKLNERFQKISSEETTQEQLSQIGPNGDDDGPHDDERKFMAQYLQQVSDDQREDGQDDDFEIFLAEAGISDNVITRLKDCSKSDQLNPSDHSIVAAADGMTPALDSALVNSDLFIDSFETHYPAGGAESEELSQLFNQANDELRLLPSSAPTTSSPHPCTNDLQDIFDSDLYENDEIRRLVSEAQDLAALERKYQHTTSAPSTATQGGGKANSKSSHHHSNSNSRSSHASLTHYDPNDYYYRTQAHNIIAERDRRKKQKKQRGRQGKRSLSDSSDSSDDDDDSSSSSSGGGRY
jgi:hypothetical protein